VTVAVGTGADTSSAVGGYALGLGDDCLILSHRLSEWAAHAPEFEEDVALSNLALDLLGQARSLLTYAGVLEGLGRTEDDLAYWRDDRQFRNLLLVEQQNGDFAVTIARHLLFSSYQLPFYERLAASTDSTLAAIAAKGVKEASYHFDHAQLWTLRLGDGTEESHLRMQAGINRMWPFTGELFWRDPAVRPLIDAGIAVDLSSIRADWEAAVDATLAAATLVRPAELGSRRGGRDGLHTEQLGHLLGEMQHLHRSHPRASW